MFNLIPGCPRGRNQNPSHDRKDPGNCQLSFLITIETVKSEGKDNTFVLDLLVCTNENLKVVTHLGYLL